MRRSSGKRTGLKRIILGWMLMAAGLLLVALFCVSAWAQVHYIWGEQVRPGHGKNAAGAARGVLFLHWTDTASWKTGFERWPHERSVHWLPPRHRGANIRTWSLWVVTFERHASGSWLLRTSGWAPAMAAMAGGAWLVRRGMRARRLSRTGFCVWCGYDLRGLPEGATCPECGKGRRVMPSGRA